jgi:hypothetical protein
MLLIVRGLFKGLADLFDRGSDGLACHVCAALIGPLLPHPPPPPRN